MLICFQINISYNQSTSGVMQIAYWFEGELRFSTYFRYNSFTSQECSFLLIFNIIIITVILMQEKSFTESLSNWKTFTRPNSAQLPFLYIITQTLLIILFHVYISVKGFEMYFTVKIIELLLSGLRIYNRYFSQLSLNLALKVFAFSCILSYPSGIIHACCS